MRRLWLFTIFSLLTLNVLAAAVGGPGTTAANYLKIGLGAKAVALGESFTAGADDTSAIYWNTAGLNSIKNSRVDFMQLNWLAGISAKTIFGAYPLSDKDTLGAYVLMLDTPQDKETVYAPDSSASGLGYHETGDKFKSAISVFNLSYARAVSRALDVGLGLKYINEDLAGEQASGLALDTGIIYKDLIPSLRLGVTLQNLGIKLLRAEEELPMTVALGAEYAAVLFNNKLNLLADVKFPNDNDPRLGFGAEYWLGDLLAGRVGYNTFSQFSLGLGVSFASLNADYAYVPMGELGVVHRISVGYTFDLRKAAAAAKAASAGPAEQTFTASSQATDLFSSSFAEIAADKIEDSPAPALNDILDQFDF